MCRKQEDKSTKFITDIKTQQNKKFVIRCS